MSFLYPFMNFFQPGAFWPELVDYKPMLVLSILAIIIETTKTSAYPRREAFSHPVFVWLMIFILVQAISLLSGGLTEVVTGFSFWSIYLIFVAASILLIRDEHSLARYVWGMMAGGMFIVMFGILAVMNEWPQAVGGRAGAYGMYENQNDYTFIIIQIVPFLYLYRTVAGTAMARLLLGASLVACMAGILLSLSRGGMLALVLEFGLIILIGMESRKRLVWLPVLVIVGAAAIGLQWAKRAENQGDNYTAEDSKNSRLELWTAGFRMVLDKPLLGVGSGQFREFAQDYGEISHDNLGKNSHNTYLEILTGTGLIGFICFVAMVSKLVRGLYRAPLAQGPPLLDVTRRATLISFFAILFRAIFDAKPHDWSFYTLCAIGLACIMLQRQIGTRQEGQAKRSGRSNAKALPLVRKYLLY